MNERTESQDAISVLRAAQEHHLNMSAMADVKASLLFAASLVTLALVPAAAGLMVLPASAVFGWLYEAFSPQVAFSGGGICALAAALWLSRLPLAMDPGLGDPGAPSSR